MQKSSVAPTISEEGSAEYESMELLVENQAFLPRALQHPLNSRMAPTVSVTIKHKIIRSTKFAVKQYMTEVVGEITD